MATVLGYGKLLNRLGGNLFIPIYSELPTYNELKLTSILFEGQNNRYNPPIDISPELTIPVSSTLQDIQSCFQYLVETVPGVFSGTGFSCLDRSGIVLTGFDGPSVYRFSYVQDVGAYPSFYPFIYKDSGGGLSLFAQWGNGPYYRNGTPILAIIDSPNVEDRLEDAAIEFKHLKVYPDKAPPIKFFLSSPKEPIYVKRGESIELVFNLQYANGSILENVPFTYPNSQPDATGITNWTIVGNTLTFTNECWYALSWIKFKSEDYPELKCEVEFHITDPMPQPNLPGPYLPPGGGISGGGNGSTGSNTVTGTFDAQPGPSIVEKLPNGSSGADIASSGMYTKYLCNNALLNLLAEFFWEDNVGIQALKAVLGNPIDSIISLTAYPFALDTLVPKTQTTIYFGQYDSHFSAFSLTKSSFQIDWGTVTIPFFWGSFLDYSPYTKIQLYLPWGVGFVSIDPNEVVPWSRKNTFNKSDFVNGTIRVITNIELDKGACVHNIVGNNGRIIGSFGGIVGKQVPVTGSDNSARILAMINAAISSSAAIGTSAGGTLAAGKNLAYGKGMSMAERAEGREMIGNYKSYVGNTVQSLSNALSSPPSYPRAGTFSDATNTLGYQYPYLIISRPSQSVPQQYGRFMGYPSNIFHAHLGEVRGYTEVSSIHLENINATANELDELESILKGGVLL